MTHTSTCHHVTHIQAVDMLMRRMKEAEFPFSRVVGVSGCGQQHGSVYWSKGAEQVLQQLDPSADLVDQLKVHE